MRSMREINSRDLILLLDELDRGDICAWAVILLKLGSVVETYTCGICRRIALTSLFRYIADWMVDGEPPLELFDTDASRYDRWATRQ